MRKQTIAIVASLMMSAGFGSIANAGGPVTVIGPAGVNISQGSIILPVPSASTASRDMHIPMPTPISVIPASTASRDMHIPMPTSISVIPVSTASRDMNISMPIPTITVTLANPGK